MPKQLAVQRVARAAADFGDAADVLRHAVAVRLGLNRTDHAILAALRAGRSASAGELATAVGLSPAATTEAVQRLTARGLLVRATDPADRRRALITMAPEIAAQLGALLAPVRDAGEELLRRYTDAELELLAEFLEHGSRLQLAQAQRIRAVPG